MTRPQAGVKPRHLPSVPHNGLPEAQPGQGNRGLDRTRVNEGHIWCSKCQREFHIEPLVHCPGCASQLEYLTPSPVTVGWRKTKRLRHIDFSPFFPMPESIRVRYLSLGEGGTPLTLCARLNGSAGPRNLYLKNEALNPTASWKDRPISLAVNCAVGFGSKVATIYSCGNAGAAAAAYATGAGIRCVVFARTTIKPNMAEAIRACGGVIAVLNISPRELWIDGRIAELLNKAQAELGWFPLTTVSNPPIGSPYYTEGYKSIAYEIALEMERPPDWVAVPVGLGEGLRGIWKGFQEAYRFGWTSKLPKMIGVQAGSAAPLVAAFEKRANKVIPAVSAKTVASGIEVMMSSHAALHAVYESGGCAVRLTDREICEARYLVARRQGLNIAPEGAATVAAALKLQKSGRIRRDDCIVCISTASGIKYPSYRAPSSMADRILLEPCLNEIESYVQKKFRQ